MAYPQLKNKHAYDALISPRDYLAYQHKRERYDRFKPPLGVIFCYYGQLMEHVARNHAVKKVARFHGEMYLLGEAGHRIALVGKFGFGAPAAVNLLEKLVALGVQSFISVGTAGSLQRELPIGATVICERAIRDEGTSHHYLKPAKYAHASAEMTALLKASCQANGQRYTLGTSWTTDAPYRETVAEVRHYRKAGVATVDMETAALFAVAQFRHVPMGALFVVSDSLAGSRWMPGFHLKKTTEGLERLYRIARQALAWTRRGRPPSHAKHRGALTAIHNRSRVHEF